MEQHRLRLLPVMEETGVLLGLISEEHILEAWGEDPLQLVSEVMAESGFSWGEEEEGVRLLMALEPERPTWAYGT